MIYFLKINIFLELFATGENVAYNMHNSIKHNLHSMNPPWRMKKKRIKNFKYTWNDPDRSITKNEKEKKEKENENSSAHGLFKFQNVE